MENESENIPKLVVGAPSPCFVSSSQSVRQREWDTKMRWPTWWQDKSMMTSAANCEGWLSIRSQARSPAPCAQTKRRPGTRHLPHSPPRNAQKMCTHPCLNFSSRPRLTSLPTTISPALSLSTLACTTACSLTRPVPSWVWRHTTSERWTSYNLLAVDRVRIDIARDQPAAHPTISWGASSGFWRCNPSPFYTAVCEESGSWFWKIGQRNTPA